MQQERPDHETILAAQQRSQRSIGDVGSAEIRNRFGYHRPTPENAGQHVMLRPEFIRFAEQLDMLLPGGRAKSLVFIKLQEASMWAHFAIAELAPVVED